MKKQQKIFPHFRNNLVESLSTQEVFIDGMKVMFDKTAPLVSVSLHKKVEKEETSGDHEQG
ncbi:MAG: hypothetical protein KDC66_17335 [Phaeodactylibacter sp.]|nr:hypothetical protein [Phaeodactylibacter sp.]MCB9273724.1 hypothetical protein [Lewinellaceae bacterium]